MELRTKDQTFAGGINNNLTCTLATLSTHYVRLPLTIDNYTHPHIIQLPQRFIYLLVHHQI